MKTKVEIEDGKVVIVLIPENEFEERVIEDYDNSGKEGEIYVIRKSNSFTFDKNGVIQIILRERVQPPTNIFDGKGTGILVNINGAHKHGQCTRYGLQSTAVTNPCLVNERSAYTVCPICGSRDIIIIKEETKPFGE